jgi:O-antigen/teichoic acid export membrane protein
LTVLKNLIDQIKSSSLKLRFLKGLLWNAIGIFASRLFLLISSFLVARMLGRESFGELGIIQSTIGMFGVFAGLGLGLTSIKYLAEFKFKDKARAGRIISLTNLIALIISSLLALILILLSPLIASETLAAQNLSLPLQLSSVLLFFSTLNGIQISILTGIEKFKRIAEINLLNGILTFLLITVGAFYFRLLGAVVALNLSILLTYLYSYYIVRIELKKNNIKLSFKNCFKEKHILINFSLPAFLAGALVSPVNWICSVILVNQKNGYAEMGVYNAANQLFSVLLFLPGIVGNTILPMLTEKITEQDSNSSKKLIQYSIVLNGIIILPIIIISMFFSDSIMSLYGSQYSQYGNILVITIITALIYAIQLPVGNMITATGKMWVGFLTNLFWGSIFIGFIFIIQLEGAINLAYSRLIAYFLLFIVSFFIINKYIKRR